MNRRTFLATLFWMACATSSLQAAPQKSDVPIADVIPTRGGAIRITPLFYGTLQIEYRGKLFVIDPVSVVPWKKKADNILITHGHSDHMDLPAISKIGATLSRLFAPTNLFGSLITIKSVGEDNIELIPMSSHESKYPDFDRKTFLALGSTSQDNWRIEPFPAYNLVRGPKPGQKYHLKGDGNGYILTLGGKRIYIAGDTEATPEMKALKNIDVAFLPMNLPYTMTPQEAAEAAKAFKPKIVYPYHYRYPLDKTNDNPQQFAAALEGTGIEVRIRNWYPQAAVQRIMADTKTKALR